MIDTLIDIVFKYMFGIGCIGLFFTALCFIIKDISDL